MDEKDTQESCGSDCGCSRAVGSGSQNVAATIDEERNVTVFHSSIVNCPEGTGPKCMCKTDELDMLHGMLPLDCCNKQITDLPENTTIERLEGVCGCGKGNAFKFTNEGGKIVFEAIDSTPSDARPFRSLPSQREY